MPASLWELRADRAEPAYSTEPLDALASARPLDVLVVGGGLTGLSTALLLAEAGRRVAVVESRLLGAGTTGRSTAKLSLLQGTHLQQVERLHGTKALRQYVAAHRAGQEWAAQVAEAEGVPLQRRPAVTYANGAAGARRLRRELAAAERAGLPVRWSEDTELPFGVAGSIWLDGQLQTDPLALVAALADRCRRLGVPLVERARVTALRDRSPVQVDVAPAPHGRAEADAVRTLEAQQVVLATNVPLLDRGGFFARMAPQRSYSVAFTLPAQRVTDLPRGMYLSADAPSRSVRDAGSEDGSPVLLVGGDGHTTGRSRPTSQHLDSIRSWTREHYPGATEQVAWSAQDFSPHHALPYAGPLVPGNGRILVAGGFSKWGMTGGVAAALALAGDLAGGAPDWRDLLQPWSRRELKGLPTSARLNAEVAAAMTLGWAGAAARRCGLRKDAVGATSPPPGGAPVCTHLGGVLSWNDAERSWDCPLHGSRFGADGGVLDGPAVRDLVPPAESDGATPGPTAG
ncbi:FAD-dependent oxidoreductase [Nocardioides zeae]|uniref:FAD-dependent oxidoreductase n=1 Tax=Nocardioides imazamoxiresistens TaxID=3231893 RepID=A0ABU3PQH5_9ACTN|nr:FAD-dependent oxidoreductase [Nocardioides zeae]MDT9591448.1 FAD-dependent oxidoreductase [Nocardioides zeae]